AGSTPGRDVASRLIEAHAVASGLLVGTYERPDGTVKADDAERVGSKATVTSVGPGGLAGGCCQRRGCDRDVLIPTAEGEVPIRDSLGALMPRLNWQSYDQVHRRPW